MNKSKGGAKGKYSEWLTDEGLLKVEGWARDGLTDEQISQNMGIAYSTLRTWRDKFSALSAALKRGKEVIDRQVENALLKRALGYEYTEKKYEQVQMSGEEYHMLQKVTVQKYKLEHPDATLEEIRLVELGVSRYKSVLVEERTKEVVPDTTAQIFWLKNRKSDIWRDKQQVEHSGGITNTIAEMTPEERQKRIDELKAKLK
ncbi:helix-turn-helix domain-containing protein [Lysinibacillus sp. NPDC047702]|uniref:helix-turn-helix domain-containing protein n=1 Tax=unclassified Lysinibacillus TaxID=2636778 RepID=UPI003D06241B